MSGPGSARAPHAALVNVDVPDLAAGVAFYRDGLGFVLRRKLFDGRVAEMAGAGLGLFLLEAPEGAATAQGQARRLYARHWTPVHLDLIVDDVAAAVARAEAAGARCEGGIRITAAYELAPMADPFGHGFCLMRLSTDGYAAVAAP